MRQEFFGVTSWADVIDLAPWATVYQRVDGGWIAFESTDDHDTWKAQQ